MQTRNITNRQRSGRTAAAGSCRAGRSWRADMTIAARNAHALARPRRLALSIPRWLRIGGAAWLATRLAMAGILAGAHLVAAYTGRTLSFDRWDTRSYIAIAGHGYATATSPNFFPLLPLLQASIGRILAGGRDPSDADLLAAGLAVSAVSTLVAFCALAALVELEADAGTAAAAVRLLAAYTLALMFERMSRPGVLITLDLGLVIVFAALTIGVFMRMRPAYGVLTAGLLLAVLVSPVPSHKDAVQSAGRYLLAAFPAFWMAARWVAGRPWLEFALVAAGFPLQATLA